MSSLCLLPISPGHRAFGAPSHMTKCQNLFITVTRLLDFQEGIDSLIISSIDNRGHIFFMLTEAILKLWNADCYYLYKQKILYIFVPSGSKV